MKRLAIHGMWTARQAIYQAYDRHCEGRGDRTFGYMFAAVVAVCVAASPWHPHQLIIAVPAGLMAAAILVGRKREDEA